jgi:hypothetical protein
MEHRISVIIGFYSYLILAQLSKSDTQFWIAMGSAIFCFIAYVFLLKNRKK